VVSAATCAGNESVRSDASHDFCSFIGRVSVTRPTGSSNSGSVPIY